MDPKDENAIQDASLSREQLTPVAREPKGDATAEGWGSYDRFPIEDREDEPVLGDTRLKPDDRSPSGVEPVHPTLVDTQAWPTSEARDFRRDEYTPECVRPVTEPPPSETETDDQPEPLAAGRDQ